MNRGLLVSLLTLRGGIGPQPQRDVCRLHRLPDHPHQFGVQRLKIGLLSQLGGEGFEGLSSIVLAAVEAPIYERLDAASQRIE
jgi:hypothetical protein